MINLSIIIPYYNNFDNLPILISIIKNFNDIEVLLIDDCSNQDSDLFAKFISQNHFIRYFKNEEKKGAGYSRNIGIENAKGKFLIFLDSDDLLTEDFYQKLAIYFNTDYDIVYFSPTSNEKSKKRNNRHISFQNLVEKYNDNSSQINLLNLKFKFMVPWSKLYRKSFLLLNLIRFD
jgi:glycosyltransferase involved in cell wall biosynthesis